MNTSTGVLELLKAVNPLRSAKNMVVSLKRFATGFVPNAKLPDSARSFIEIKFVVDLFVKGLADFPDSCS